MSRQPINHTCPDIDKAIKLIKSLIKQCEPPRYSSNLEEDLQSNLDSISSDLPDIIDCLEYVRKANESLRAWGEDEASQVDKLENRVYELEEEIESLKQTV